MIGLGKMRMRFATPTGLNSMPNSVQIHPQLWKIIGAEGFDFLQLCDLESRSSHLDCHHNVEEHCICHQAEFETNPNAYLR